MRPAESRYSRQIRFAPLGEEGQARIRAASVAIVGCGALGTVQAEALARAGVGRLRIIDRDFVEWSNLQRQFLFDEADAAEALPKAVAAARRLARVNSEVTVEPMVADLTAANVEELFEDIDLILDGTDNFETRFLINDVAVDREIPWIYGAAVGSYGIKLAIVPGVHGLFPLRLSRASAGRAAHLRNRRRAGAGHRHHRGAAGRRCAEDPGAGRGCRDRRGSPPSTCGPEPSGSSRLPRAIPNAPAACAANSCIWTGPGARPSACAAATRCRFTNARGPWICRSWPQRLGTVAPVRSNEFALRVALDPYELTVFPDGRAIIKGTTDVGVARSLYARYIGA